MVKFPVDISLKQALYSHPTNIKIVEITPSLRVSDYGKRLYAHLFLSFDEEHMYLWHDTHHVTVFSIFSLMYRPKTEMKTCQFGTI